MVGHLMLDSLRSSIVRLTKAAISVDFAEQGLCQAVALRSVHLESRKSLVNSIVARLAALGWTSE